MSRISNLARCGLIAGVALGLAAPTAFADPVRSTPSARRDSGCFFIREWQGWKSPAPDVLYIGMVGGGVYRIGLSGGSQDLQRPDVHLTSELRGTDIICSPLDLDLAIADGHGLREPLIAKTITKLNADEIAAIPKKYRP